MLYQRLDGYQACKLFMAVRSHFTNKKFDIFGGSQIRYSKEHFEARNDRTCFDAVSYEYAKGDLAYYFMTNYLNGSKHPREMTHLIYKEWKSKIYRLDKLFEEDCKKIRDKANKHNLKFNDFFISSNGGLPISIQMMNGNLISIETICIIDKIFNGFILERMNRQITDDFIWPKKSLYIEKYSPWLDRHINLKNTKNILQIYK